MTDELGEIVNEAFDEVLSILMRSLQGDFEGEAIVKIAGTIMVPVARAIGEAARRGQNSSARDSGRRS